MIGERTALRSKYDNGAQNKLSLKIDSRSVTAEDTPMLRLLLALMVGSLCMARVSAQDLQPEKIPAPKVIQQPEPAPLYFEPYTPRTGSIEVWQHYGVNRLGRFVPRVILLPEGGAYYSRDLQPYPWLPRPGATMPYTID
jgi:hypothetical protein